MAQAPPFGAPVYTSPAAPGALPHNLEAERALLGALVLDNSQIDVALDRIPTEALRGLNRSAAPSSRRERDRPAEPLFFSAAHQSVFAAILAIHDTGSGVDLTTLAEQLLQRGQLELVGGAPFLAGLEEDIFALSQAPRYAEIVVEKWRLRCLIRASQLIIEDALNADTPAPDIIDRAEKRIFDVSLQQQSPDFVHVREVLPEIVTQIEERAKGLADVAGLSTGFRRLDQLTTGLHPAQLVILAARPSMGKTALALNIASNVALRQGRPVGVFTLEMSKHELLGRIVSTEAKVSMGRLRGTQGLRRDELDMVHEAAQRIHAAPLWIDESSSLSSIEVRARARRLKSRCPDLALVVVDYLQLMSGASRTDNRQQEVAEISRALKVLAGELSIPVLALSQLSRQSEQRRGTKDRLPRLSDLRDSGAIEQDADVVLFIHRERDMTAATQGPQMPDEAILRIAKQRNGQVGDIDLLFRGEFTEFVDLNLGN